MVNYLCVFFELLMFYELFILNKNNKNKIKI